MKAVLLIAHGSSKTEQNELFIDILEMVRDLIGKEYSIYGAFISFSEMNIEVKLKEIIDDGIFDITIVPYLLFAGNHVKTTIPDVAENFLKDYPKVKITYKESLGKDKRLAEIVVDRIKN